jgi:hypothetical protein
LSSLVLSLAGAPARLSALTVDSGYQTSVALAEQLLREARQDATGSATNSGVVPSCLKGSNPVMTSFNLDIAHCSCSIETGILPHYHVCSAMYGL